MAFNPCLRGFSVCPSPSSAPPPPNKATKHKGLVYLATTNFFGAGYNRVPSIFWAIVDPSIHLCKPSLLDWGVVASEQGLALAFPVMAARAECGAFIAYAYGGNTTLTLGPNAYPAYAGECVQQHSQQDTVGVSRRCTRKKDHMTVSPLCTQIHHKYLGTAR